MEDIVYREKEITRKEEEIDLKRKKLREFADAKEDFHRKSLGRYSDLIDLCQGSYKLPVFEQGREEAIISYKRMQQEIEEIHMKLNHQQNKLSIEKEELESQKKAIERNRQNKTTIQGEDHEY